MRTTEYTDVFSYNGRAIQAFKIEQGAFNLFVYYDAQLYANELADAVDRANKRNETLDKKVQAEKGRRAKGKGRLSDEVFAKLQPQELREILSDSPEMGAVTLRTNRIDLNSNKSIGRISNGRTSSNSSEHTVKAWIMTPPTCGTKSAKKHGFS